MHRASSWAVVASCLVLVVLIGRSARAEDVYALDSVRCGTCCPHRDETRTVASAALDVVLLLDNSDSMRSRWNGLYPAGAPGQGDPAHAKARFAREFFDALAPSAASLQPVTVPQAPGITINAGIAVFPDGKAIGVLENCPSVSSAGSCAPGSLLFPVSPRDSRLEDNVRRCTSTWTPLAASLQVAGKRLTNTQHRRVVVVVTDGGNSCDGARRKEPPTVFACDASVRGTVVGAGCTAVEALVNDGIHVYMQSVGGGSPLAGFTSIRDVVVENSSAPNAQEILEPIRRDLCRLANDNFAYDTHLLLDGVELTRSSTCPTGPRASFTNGVGFCDDGGKPLLLGTACSDFISGKRLVVRTILDAQVAVPSDYGCQYVVVPDDPKYRQTATCVKLARYKLLFRQVGQRDKEVGSWETCEEPVAAKDAPAPSRTIVEVRPADAWTCPGGGSVLVTCEKTDVGDASRTCTTSDAHYLESPLCRGLGAGRNYGAEPPPAGVAPLEPLATTNPGDPSTYRLRLVAGKSLGVALGVRPFRALREKDIKKEDVPFYNEERSGADEVVAGLGDSFETSYALAAGQQVPGAASGVTGPLHAFGVAADFFELGSGGAAPGAGKRAIADCIKKGIEAANAARKMKQAERKDLDGWNDLAGELSKLTRACEADNRHAVFGPNLVLDAIEFPDRLRPTQLHAKFVGHGALGKVVSMSGQLGGDILLGGIEESAGAGIGRSSFGTDGRVDIDFTRVTGRAEAGFHVQGRLGEVKAFFSAGVGLDVELPMGIVVRPGYRATALNGEADHAGFVNVGFAHVNWDVLRPVRHYLERVTTPTVPAAAPSATPQ